MKNQDKGFIVPVLIGIIALLLIIGGGMYVYENKKVETPAVVDTEARQSDQNQQKTNTQTTPISNSKPSITVLSPNGGEMLVQGTTWTIKWSAPSSISDVKIFIEKAPCKTMACQTDTPIGYMRTIATTTNTGSYVWVIPNCTTANPCSYDFNIPVATDYLIRVSNNDERMVPVSDTSDASFTITTTELKSKVNN